MDSLAVEVEGTANRGNMSAVCAAQTKLWNTEQTEKTRETKLGLSNLLDCLRRRLS